MTSVPSIVRPTARGSSRRGRAGVAVASVVLLLVASLIVTGAILVYRPLPTMDGDYRLIGLDAASHARAVKLANLPDLIRGYEDIKLANVRRFHEEVRKLGF